MLWLIMSASLIAIWLNIHGHRSCFVVWAGTNAAWAWIDFTHGLPAQGVLQTIYLGLAVYGWLRWGESDRGQRS